MPNPFSKGWKYLTASLDQKIDENADPKVQIQQATEAAKRQHQQITDHTAAILGNQRQLEMQLDRLVKDQASLQDKARQAIAAADQAAQNGDMTKAQEFNSTAEIFASQLVSVEQQIEDTKTAHQQASTAAEQAKKQQQESEARLRDQLNQISQLRAQADQAAMQETATKSMDTMSELRPDDDVPTLDQVRAKIEQRYANALGAQELNHNGLNDRMAEITQAGTDLRANARLDEIRAQMSQAGELKAGAAAGALTDGSSAGGADVASADEAAKVEEKVAPDAGATEPAMGEKKTDAAKEAAAKEAPAKDATAKDATKKIDAGTEDAEVEE